MQQSVQQQDRLQAYQRKWNEELEGFKKLAHKLQAQVQAGQPFSPVQGRSDLASQPAVPLAHSPCQPSSSADRLAAAVTHAEALLSQVHAAAIQMLSTDAAVDNKLLIKQLRLQRNQAFEQAKALLHQAQSAGP